jgi:hypothetical protein
MMNDSITKRGNKNLSHHWISDIDELVIVRLVRLCNDFVMKPKTVFLVLLFKLKSLRSSSLATATVKVCLKYIGKVHSILQKDPMTIVLIVVVDSSVITIDVQIVLIQPEVSVVTDIVAVEIAIWMRPCLYHSHIR